MNQCFDYQDIALLVCSLVCKKYMKKFGFQSSLNTSSVIEIQKNPNYGRTKYFRCLLDTYSDDPIFIGINRLVAKGYWGEDHKIKKRRRCYMKTEDQRNQILKTLGRYKS